MSPPASHRPLAALPLFAVTLALAALVTGCAAPGDAGDGEFPEEPLTTLTSQSGGLVLEVRTAPEQPPSRGSTDVELTITSTLGVPRDDLSLTVIPFMSDMGHGASTDPTTTPIGEGRYVIADVGMFMAGRWELLTEITGPIDDSATIVFHIP